MGFEVTTGAAPGYISDKACKTCHLEKYNSYQQVAMSKSFYRPTSQPAIEAIGQTFHHEPSQNYYELTRNDEKLYFNRYQKDGQGRRINDFSVEINWILGSGNHSRTYVYQTPLGELYELPLQWYAQDKKWGMSPGYDNYSHFGIHRRISRNCMACHNAFPQVPEGSDHYRSLSVFPHTMPEGTGCQRCHGPGAEHVVSAFSGNLPEVTRSKIVNPAKLSAERRDDVCYQCHLLPNVKISQAPRFEVPIYSFRPGDDLAKYKNHIDGITKGETDVFEINHHPYRLRQSTCFKVATAEQMSCLTCHDPHVKIPAAQQKAHYRKKCQSCHQVDACMAPETGPDSPKAHKVTADDCISCHMPKRRTMDVVQATMTDHLIRRTPIQSSELTAPREEGREAVDEVAYYQPERAPKGFEAQVYLDYEHYRSNFDKEALMKLSQSLIKWKTNHLEPYIELAKGLARESLLKEAELVANFAISKFPNEPMLWDVQGVIAMKEGRYQTAIYHFRRFLERNPEQPEVHFNLGLTYFALNQVEKAEASFQEALALRPNFYKAAYYLGYIDYEAKRYEAAVEHLRHALALTPRDPKSYALIVKTLSAMGQHEEAMRYWCHGLDILPGDDNIIKAMKPAK